MFTRDGRGAHGLPLDIVTTPLDYLDKIFQVPFSLRHIGDRAGAYLASLLPEVDDGETLRPTVSGEHQRTVAADAQPSANPADRNAFREPSGDAHRVVVLGPNPGLDQPNVGGPDPAPANLRITAREREFLPQLARFVPTPRAGKKLVNLYRLVRIGVPAHELDTFIGHADTGGSHQPVAILLAVLVGRAIHANELFAAIQAGDPTDDIVDFLRADRPDPGWQRTAALRAEIADTIEGIRDRDQPILSDLSSYQRWCPEIARFSFTARDT
jgi:hypothetical protein